MQVRTTGPASVAQLVRELGVPDALAPKVAARIAKDLGVDVDGPLPAGTLLTFDDALVKVAPREQRAAVVGTKLGALGLFGLQKAADGRQKDMAQNGLGALLHLSALSLPGLLDTGKLEVKAPLKAGRASLPLGEGKTLELDVPAGTTLRLQIDVKQGARGPEVAGMDVAFSRPVDVANPAELALGKGFLAELADGAVRVHVDGVGVGKDGVVAPRGSITRPSLNPFKHVLGSGKSETSLQAVMKLAGQPTIHTQLDRLLAGDVVQSAPMKGGVPSRFSLDELTGSLGALVEQGTFSLGLTGRAGFIDVGEGRVTVRGKDAPLAATLTGSFTIDDGAIDTKFAGSLKTTTKLPVSLQLDDEGAGAGVGPVSVRTRGDTLFVSLSGQTAAAVRAAGERFQVDLADGVFAELDGGLKFAGGARLVQTAEGFTFESDGVQAQLALVEGRAQGNGFEVALGKDSQLSIEVGAVRFDGDALVIDHATSNVSLAIESAAMKKGALKARLAEPGTLTGAFALRDEALDGEVKMTVRARPRVLGVPLPKATVDAGMTAKVTAHAVMIDADRHVRVLS